MFFAVEEINFLTPLEDITLNELGLKATFECVISKEGLTAEWLKDGKPLKASDKVTIQAEGNTHRLIVAKSCAEDEGIYTVKFKGASTKAKLTIRGKRTNKYIGPPLWKNAFMINWVSSCKKSQIHEDVLYGIHYTLLALCGEIQH